MKGVLRRMQVNQNTNEFLYDLGQKEINTEEEN